MKQAYLEFTQKSCPEGSPTPLTAPLPKLPTERERLCQAINLPTEATATELNSKLDTIFTLLSARSRLHTLCADGEIELASRVERLRKQIVQVAVEEGFPMDPTITIKEEEAWQRAEKLLALGVRLRPITGDLLDKGDRIFPFQDSLEGELPDIKRVLSILYHHKQNSEVGALTARELDLVDEVYAQVRDRTPTPPPAQQPTPAQQLGPPSWHMEWRPAWLDIEGDKILVRDCGKATPVTWRWEPAITDTRYPKSTLLNFARDYFQTPMTSGDPGRNPVLQKARRISEIHDPAEKRSATQRFLNNLYAKYPPPTDAPEGFPAEKQWKPR